MGRVRGLNFAWSGAWEAWQHLIGLGWALGACGGGAGGVRTRGGPFRGSEALTSSELLFPNQRGSTL